MKKLRFSNQNLKKINKIKGTFNKLVLKDIQFLKARRKYGEDRTLPTIPSKTRESQMQLA